MDDKTVKNNIRRIREARNITQQEMAEQLGISRTAYRNLESGSTKILSSSLSRISEITGTSQEEIVLGYVPSDPDDNSIADITASFEEKRQSIIREYEERIEHLNGMIDVQKETIRSKNELIEELRVKNDWLQKQLEKKNI